MEYLATLLVSVVGGLAVLFIWDRYKQARPSQTISRSARARARGGQLQEYNIEIYKKQRTGSTFNIVGGHKDIISKMHHRIWSDQFENPYDAMDKAEGVIKKLDANGKVDGWTIKIT